MRILGIAIAYPPSALSSSEGLIRLLMFLIRGGLQCGAKIVILCPLWSRDDLLRLIQDSKIPPEFKNQIKIISTDSIPPALVLYLKYIQWIHRIRKPSIFGRFFKWAQQEIIELILKIAGTNSWIILFFALIFSILFSPLIILAALVFLLIRHTQKSNSGQFGKKFRGLFSRSSKPLVAYKNNYFARRILSIINKHEFNHLAELAKRQSEVHTWLIPTPFWPELVERLDQTIVVCPDSVITNFPVGFERDAFGERVVTLRSEIQKSLNSAGSIITYSNYVKNAQIIEKFAIPENKIVVIPHGHIDLADSLSGFKSFNSMNLAEKRDLCLQIVHEYLKSHASDEYLRNFDFSGVKFLMYTSQHRPSKNFPSLIKAYHKILHEKNEPIKLVLTGNPKEIPNTSDLISKLGLSRDVVILPHLPTCVMAAMYHLAVLAVNPTLTEGGFPFTFSEAYSVGTPSVMSKIPVTTEYISDLNLQKIMLFDPYNLEEIVNKIHWGLHHREELLIIERSLYDQLQKRSWAKVAKEYLEVLDNIENQIRA
jgi:glycosyltransferase involved in cell wall biosynthesis